MSQSSTRQYPSLSVVIVNWNSKDYLRQCLRSIEEHGEGLATQIVVVDGGSFDGCDAMLAKEFPYVEFVQAEDNIGFARSNNLGFKKVTSQYVLLLNPDTELTPNALRILLETAINRPNAGIIGPKLLNTDGSLQTSCVQAFPTPLNQMLDSNFLRRWFPKSNLWKTHAAFTSHEPVTVEALSGACMLLESSLYKSLGGFCEDYFMYAEDMDLSLQSHRAGRKNLNVPEAAVVHHGGGCSATRPSKFSVQMKCQSLYYYFKKNFSDFKAFLFRILIFISSLARLPILTFFKSIRKEVPMKLTSTSLLRSKYMLQWSLIRKRKN